MGGVVHKRLRGAFLAFAIVILGALAFSVACQREHTPVARAANSGGKEIRTITVPIEGMSCGACAASVKKTLKAIEGVREVRVNLEQRNASIEYEPGKVAPEQLTTAINKLGYKTGTPAPGESQ